jgi:hypothetical protein
MVYNEEEMIDINPVLLALIGELIIASFAIGMALYVKKHS